MCEFGALLNDVCAQKPYLQDLTKNLLLGNGYSIAACDLFQYSELFEKADFSDMPQVECLFNTYATRNFEAVLEALGHAERVGRCLPPPVQRPTAAECRAWLIEEFIRTLERVHPDNLFTHGGLTYITDEMYIRNGSFLGLFDTIFTLNYDLLLYRSILHNQLERVFTDCFWGLDGAPLQFTPTLLWGPKLCYLHGALHLRKSPENVAYKVRYAQNYNLLAHLHNDLLENKYPLIVFEGQNQEKVNTISNDAYLTYVNNIFSKINGMLVTFGFSFGANDQHIIDSIIKSGISFLLVGVYGDVPLETQIWLNTLAAMAKKNYEGSLRSCPLEIMTYDTSKVRIW